MSESRQKLLVLSTNTSATSKADRGKRPVKRESRIVRLRNGAPKIGSAVSRTSAARGGRKCECAHQTHKDEHNQPKMGVSIVRFSRRLVRKPEMLRRGVKTFCVLRETTKFRRTKRSETQTRLIILGENRDPSDVASSITAQLVVCRQVGDALFVVPDDSHHNSDNFSGGPNKTSKCLQKKLNQCDTMRRACTPL